MSLSDFNFPTIASEREREPPEVSASWSVSSRGCRTWDLQLRDHKREALCPFLEAQPQILSPTYQVHDYEPPFPLTFTNRRTRTLALRRGPVLLRRMPSLAMPDFAS